MSPTRVETPRRWWKALSKVQRDLCPHLLGSKEVTLLPWASPCPSVLPSRSRDPVSQVARLRACPIPFPPCLPDPPRYACKPHYDAASSRKPSGALRGGLLLQGLLEPPGPGQPISDSATCMASRETNDRT